VTKISAILLAAGLSSRMEGANKLLLELDGKTVMRHTYEQLARSEVDEIIVVTGRDKALITKSLSLRPTDKFVHNPDFEQGMTSSIQAGVRTATHEAFMICLADMPLLTAGNYKDVMDAFNKVYAEDQRAILTPVVYGKKANPVVFSRYYRKAILSHTKKEGCRGIVLSNINHRVEYISENPAYLQDLDTMEDFKKLQQ
jgi:molybdenum cofactor cytidylyltransferase